jgi:hypothetical protein
VERKALALTLAMGATGAWNIDMSCSARETLPNYEALSYYALWIEGLQKVLTEHGLLRDAEVLAGRYRLMRFSQGTRDGWPGQRKGPRGRFTMPMVPI